MSPLRRLWEYATEYRSDAKIATIYSFLNKLFDLAPPLLIGAAVDIVVRRENSILADFGVEDTRTQIVVLAVMTFTIWGLESFFQYVSSLKWRNLAQSIQHELRMDAYGHVQGLELSYFEDRATGDLMAVLNDDVNQLERFLDTGADDVIQTGATVVLIGIVFFVLAPSVAWMAFIPIPFILWGSIRYQRTLEPRYAAVREQAAEINSQLSNNLGGIATIKSFIAEKREVARLGDTSQRYREANRSAIKLSSAFSPLIRIVILVGFTATLVFGGFQSLDGSLEVGAYSVMVFLTQRLLWPLTRLGQTFDLYQRAMASTSRVLNVLDTEVSLADGTVALPRKDVDGAFAFENVTFAYSEGPVVLDGLSVEIPARKTTAFVGSTGAGKTTLVKLLLRFYDPVSGRVTLDGRDLRELQVNDLRHAIGVVSQDVFLFHGSVRDNIAYGKPDADFEDIVRAAKIAEADEFINELADGYDTIVGERGQKLSGGQRQRISIARAVLIDPPILVLDEATSSVDNETEAAIQRSFDRLSVDRTTIVIAHRLSTIRYADRIYVLDRGQVAQQGTHDQLADAEGIYSGLWSVQTGEAHDRRPGEVA
ncbi:MAG: ABC transporter ATP-binding protein [Acidimicrobiia bacterium]|nr:ABC transporter ATP-binding protein/permease [Acidimicrobiia bacterium]NNF65807.1 ABC transporter ATP-binding protein [Acidimicrobiia bacterium]